MEGCKINSPLVSIIIPVFNRKDLVKEMIDSIINQTYSNWELLLIDDGSESDTLDLLSKYVEIDKRIHLYRRERIPKGAPTCRNIGLINSKGNYIVFLDSDDLLPSITLQQRVDFMMANNNIDFGIFPAISFNKKIGEYDAWCRGIKIGNNDLPLLIDSYLPFLVVTNIYKKESLINKNIYWDEKLASLQDADFNIQNILKGNKYQYAQDAFIDYYIRIIPQSNSISQNIYKSSHVNSHLYFIKKIYNSLNKKQVNKYRWAIRRRIIYIYSLLGFNNIPGRDNLKKIIHKYDNKFYYLFICSINIYNFLRTISCPKSNILAFPYFYIYMYFENIFINRKTKNIIKNKIQNNINNKLQIHKSF